ncbi:MAG: biotin--[acetyl-CoA-carboxylase] ligase [Alphaproteobacteria bacterium]|nr:biotin--[acetyl-CoA-carboxylase] ligase [Alphaproteobacteria bacterium]
MIAAPPRLPQGFRLLAYDRLGSSNDEAKLLARDGAAEWTIVWTREQTAGRGRRGRQFIGVPGNLYVSIILRPDCLPAAAAQLGFVAALGVGDALEALAPPETVLRYKWPNDVLLNGNKVAGILLESEMTSCGTVDWLVAGVGVNVEGHPGETAYPATSLRAEGFAAVSAAMVLEAFAPAFRHWTDRWRREGFAPIRAQWLRGAVGRGETVTVQLDRDRFDGCFADLDGDGALLVETPAGRRRVAAGDVFPARG